jgi:predicted transglutaminase-like cysteine proteinase
MRCKDALFHRMNSCLSLFCYILLTILCVCSNVSYGFTLPTAALQQAQAKYGAPAIDRLTAWENLINQHQHIGELAKLRLVNDFFNQFAAISDKLLWKENNYWATPIEFLGHGGGDCEDFVIAKYFTLKAMGISIDKLRIVYVTSDKFKEPHMVLAYYETPHDDPLILDNVTPWILYGSERPDLTPVYTFNGQNIWLIVENNTEKKMTESKNFSLWQHLIEKMHLEFIPKDMTE